LAVIMTLGLGTAAADEPTWTVTVGSAPRTVDLHYATIGSHTSTEPDVFIQDTTSGINWSCDSGSGNGSTTVGSGRSGAGIAQLDGTATTWTNCVGPLGIELDFVFADTWYWQADSYDSVTGVMTGRITGITGHATTPDGSSCTLDVTVTSTRITRTVANNSLSALTRH
jgi:hypothetical protein